MCTFPLEDPLCPQSAPGIPPSNLYHAIQHRFYMAKRDVVCVAAVGFRCCRAAAPCGTCAACQTFCWQPLATSYANPVMVVDEIDKSAADGTYDPLGALYSLLAHDTAAEFSTA